MDSQHPPQPSQQPDPGHAGRPGQQTDPGQTGRPGQQADPGQTGRPGQQADPGQAGQPGQQTDPGHAGRPDQQPVVVVTQQGMAVAGGDGDERSPAELVEQPAKVMRIGSMIKQLLEEVRNAPLDEAGRSRLAEVHERSLTELEEGLAPELVEELRRITLPFDEDSTPTDAELRIAQAQLVGWLEGLFHGIQTALFAQQMAARAQIEQMRHALPGGPGAVAHPQPGMPGMAGPPGPDDGQQRSTGQYL